MISHSLIVVTLLVALSCAAETAATSWARVEKTDALRGTAYSQFTLTGRFLTPPKHNTVDPLLVLKCVPGERSRGLRQHRNGKFLDAYVALGSVVDFHNTGTQVRYRLDDSKIHEELWGHSTDGTAVFPSEIQVNTLLYGHFMPHKEGTGSATHKIVIAVDEYLGAEIVMEFDLPDPEIPADACGIILHRK